MRSKEEAHDYRYFPDPDLLPLELDQAWVDGLAKALPELPDAKRRASSPITGSPPTTPTCWSPRRRPPIISRRWPEGSRRQGRRELGDQRARRPPQPRRQRAIADSPVSAAQLGAIIDLIAAGTISGKIAKDVFEIVWAEGGDPAAIVEARGLRQVTDTGAIEKLVDDVLAANPDKVADAKTKPAVLGWFVGQVMKATGGKANPQAVNALLKAKLGL